MEEPGFAPELFAALFRAEPGHFWFRARNRLVIWAMATYFPHAQSVFEIGCGTGYVLAGVREAFPSLACAGGDVFPEGLDLAAGRLPGVPLYQMDAGRMPFDAEFDIVLACDVLEHLDDDAGALSEMFRTVVPGGGVVITVPQHPFLWSAVDDQSRHRRRYRRHELVRALDAAGFERVRTWSFASLVMPAMWLSRVGRRRAPAVDQSAAFHPGRVANAALESIMTVERAMITRGASLPFGGSLLAVAFRGGQA